MEKRFTFGKAEHLKLEKDIDRLFSAGSRASTVHPVRAVYRLVPATDGVRVRMMVSVAKKRLRHAVDRNRTKRLLREAYRLHKHLLTEFVPEGYSLHLGLIWLISAPADWAKLERSVERLLHMVSERGMQTPETPSSHA